MTPALSNLSLHTSVLLLFVGLLIPTSSHNDEHVAMFIFGDSFFDPGNNNYINVTIDERANYRPYGESFFKFPTGRFSNGRLTPDFIAMHANLPLWRPYLQPGSYEFTNGANFASGGSGVLDETNPGTISLRMQLSSFKVMVSLLRQTLGDAEAKKILTKAVYMCSTGNNDIGQFVTDHPYNATKLEQQTFTKILIGNLTEVIKEIYKIGGRKFAIQNVTPMGCIPIVRQDYNLSGNECAEVPHVMASRFNRALSEVAKELEVQLSGFKYSILDFYSTILDRINDPLKYGFKEAYTACCGSGTYHASYCGVGRYELCKNVSEYLFFDGSHQTEHAYSQVAELWWNGAPNTTGPYNMKQLFELESAIEISSEDFGALIDE